MKKHYSMLRVIQETSKAVRSGPVELRRAAEVAETEQAVQGPQRRPRRKTVAKPA